MLNKWIIGLESDWFPSHFLILIYEESTTYTNKKHTQKPVFQHVKSKRFE